MQIQAAAPKSFVIAVAALACGLLTLSPRSARADEPRAAELVTSPTSDGAQAANLARMEGELDLFAGQAKRQRTATALTTVGAAGALVPAGYVLLRRSDPVAQSIGWGMALGGAVPLLFMVPALLPTRVERLRNAFEERRASGMPADEVLRRTEEDWERIASAAHTRRVVIGIVDLTLGAASTAAGLYFLLSDSVGKMDRNDQYILGSSLVGPGVPMAAFGFRSLLQQSLEETSWEAYRAAKGPAEPKTAKLAMPAVSVAPLRGGAVAVATYAF